MHGETEQEQGTEQGNGQPQDLARLSVSDLRRKFQAAREQPRELRPVTPPGLDGVVVYARTLKSGEFEKWQSSVMTQKGGRQVVNLEDLRGRFVVLTIVDHAGAPVFTDADLPWLRELGNATIAAMYAEAAKLNGVSEEDLEEMVKKSAAVQRLSS